MTPVPKLKMERQCLVATIKDQVYIFDKVNPNSSKETNYLDKGTSYSRVLHPQKRKQPRQRVVR